MKQPTRSLGASPLQRQAYPKNLLLTASDGWNVDLPPELTADVCAGIGFALSLLTEREQTVLQLRYEHKKSLSEIGRILSRSTERVRQVESNAFRKLRKPENWTWIQHGILGTLKRAQTEAHNLGFEEGFEEGFQYGLSEATQSMSKNGLTASISCMPIEVLELSSRAFHGLQHAGYHTIGAVCLLLKEEIVRIPGLGPKSFAEIAHALQKRGIQYTAWDIFATHNQTE